MAGTDERPERDQYGKSKSMDKRLAAMSAAMKPRDFLASLAMHCDDDMRRRKVDDAGRHEFREALTRGFDAMRTTLGEDWED